ncbi:putative maltose permease (MalP) [Penicillium subrubescens]|nr:putative maltose permease (MalP) [Penicillium subrubescens]KAJ5890614.1 putative maltose permease (MalP) [Penicillium subrubescens]
MSSFVRKTESKSQYLNIRVASVQSKIQSEHLDSPNTFDEDHVEQAIKPSDTAADAAAKDQAASVYENTSLWQTVKLCEVAIITCFAAAFSAATDGYQIGMNGNIIANQGFVKQFATDVNAKSTPYLGAPVLAGWSSIMSVGQIIGMVTIPFISSRFGRKIAMFTYWLISTSSVLAESLARSRPVWLIAKLLAGTGVGCLQSTLPVYISPWWSIGSFFAYIVLNIMAKERPLTRLAPVYTQWVQIGIMIIIYVFLPESPAWCATRGDGERVKKELLKLNRGVKDYNLEQQYELLILTVEHEKQGAVE